MKLSKLTVPFLQLTMKLEWDSMSVVLRTAQATIMCLCAVIPSPTVNGVSTNSTFENIPPFFHEMSDTAG